MLLPSHVYRHHDVPTNALQDHLEASHESPCPQSDDESLETPQVQVDHVVGAPLASTLHHHPDHSRNQLLHLTHFQ
jgi:hypothetical protein